MKKLVFVATLAVGVMACSSTREYLTNYPPTQESMERIEANAVKMGCEFDKLRVLGWSVGMRQAEVTCPDGREIVITADAREYGDRVLDANTLADTTSYECDGTIEDDEAACKKFMAELWDGTASASN